MDMFDKMRTEAKENFVNAMENVFDECLDEIISSMILLMDENKALKAKIQQLAE